MEKQGQNKLRTAGFLRRKVPSIVTKKEKAQDPVFDIHVGASAKPSDGTLDSEEKLLHGGQMQSTPNSANSSEPLASYSFGTSFSTPNVILYQQPNPSIDGARRSSQVSNTSQVSASNMPSAQYLAQHRASLSSFASSTGSPRAPPSSNGTTIGDLSTADMPLIPPERRHVDDESADSSHFYPPAATSNKQRGSRSYHSPADLYNQGRLGSVTSIESSNRRRTPDSQMFTQPTSSHSTTTVHLTSPLMPLRKRLLRSMSTPNGSPVSSLSLVIPDQNAAISSSVSASLAALAASISEIGLSERPRRIPLEVQLLAELVDAAENFIAYFDKETPELSYEQTQEKRTNHLTEIVSLIRELCENSPEARRAFGANHYAPMSLTTIYSVEQLLRTSERQDWTLQNWWPRRLSRDCQGMLEEVGIVTVSRIPATFNDVEGLQDPPNTPSSPSPNETERQRQEELLKEGRKRWEEWRERENAIKV